MDMVRGDHEIQHLQTISLFRFEQPMLPPLPVSTKSEQKFLFMAAMGNMPDLPWNIISIRSWHFS